MVQLNARHRSETFPVLLLFILCGAITLPMLPIWQGTVRLLAGLVLIRYMDAPPRTKRIVGSTLAICVMASAVYWLKAFLETPAGHIIASFSDVYGQPLGIIPDGLLLFADALCLAGLFTVIQQSEGRTVRLIHLFCGALLLFWGSALVTVIAQAINPSVGQEALAQMMTGLSGWATWLYWAALALLLLRDEASLRTAMGCLGIAGGIVGAVIVLQWLLGDFSYMISGHGASDETFNRVRGTDYYHAPAAFAVAVGSLALFSLMRRDDQPGPMIIACILVGIVALNNTRGVSLALLAGLVIALVGGITKKLWMSAASIAVVLSLTLTNVFYLKPAYQPASFSENSAETSAQAVESPGTTPEPARNIASTNQPRARLAKEGINMVLGMPFIGEGIGTLELQLEGDAFDGMLSTYSTHTLYLDIALMGGLVALAGFLLALACAAYGALTLVIRRACNDAIRHTAVHLLALLLAFAVAWLFIPQERNELSGIFVFVTALAVRAASLNNPGASTKLQVPKSGYVLLAIAATGWAIGTSPRYVFPAIELVARYGGEIIEKGQHVYVTEPTVKELVRRLIKLRGGTNSQVSLLVDGPQAMVAKQSWIVWNPASAKRYPILIEKLNAWRHVYHDATIGYTPPPNWWIMPSAQPVTSFIFSGIRVPIGRGQTPLPDDISPTYPNAAPYARIKVDGGIVGSPSNAADYNHGSAVYWRGESQESAYIQFSLDTVDKRELRMYLMTALPFRSMIRAKLYSWILEGSNDEQTWDEIDRRVNERLSQEGKSPSAYLVSGNTAYPHYRFRFITTGQSHAVIAGIAEIELFFSPATIPQIAP